MEVYDPAAEFEDRAVCECGKHIPTKANGGIPGE